MKKSERHEKILKHLHCLPKRLLRLQEQENLPAFVLYELCHEECFDLNKAAYFVDNPDFDCLKGVAGVYKDEDCLHGIDIDNDPDLFSQAMNCSPFNTKVKQIARESLRRNKQDETKCMNELAQILDLKNPHCYSWDMKHDNFGFLLIENGKNLDWDEDYLQDSLYFLNFCPLH